MSKTCSVELAQKLYVLNLQHEPVEGDWYLLLEPFNGKEEAHYLEKPSLVESGACAPFDEDIWLPTLSDLLERLEGMGYKIDLGSPYLDDKYELTLWQPGYGPRVTVFGETWEDAAALALIWALEQEGVKK